MADTEPIATVHGLRKKYDSITAVDGVSFNIIQGEVFGLLGPNGAGKTTTISILSGSLQPTDGEVRVAGFDARKSAPAMRMALGVVPQELAIYLKLTGRENLEFFGSLYGMRGDALNSRVDSMLAMVGLTERAGDRSAEYSGGMKRRLNLAVGLMHNPRLLLLDEPTVGVDPQSRNHIFEGVRELNKQGLTVLYTSHYMEEVEALCHRVGIMDRGKLIACDTVPNLIASLGGSMVDVGIGSSERLPALTSHLATLELVKEVEITAPLEDSGSQGSEENPHTLHIRTEQPNRVLPLLVGALTKFDVPLYSLSIREPNLEDVFLTLTGKTLRD
jgi:ABC-2 type transport system ATP-binding protein